MNYKNIKILGVIILVAIFVANIGVAGPKKKYGTSAAPELLIPVGSAGTSLSGANLSSISGVDAMYWNPAGLSAISSKTGEAMVSHMNYVADMNLQYIGGAFKLGNIGVLGASVKIFNVGDILQTTEYYPEGTGVVIKPTYITGTIGLARQMTDRIRFGANIKYISENVADVSANAFAFDFGLQYIGGNTGLSFGIALKNLGPQLTFNGPGLDQTSIINGQKITQRITLQSFDLPTNLEIGMGYKKAFGKDNNIGLSVAFKNSSFSSDEFKVGLEYNYKDFFYVRGAYNIFLNSDENNLFGPTIGAGLHYPVGSLILGFDYAYRFVTESAINSTNQFFTLHVGF
jgi:hypothetical protein